MIQKVCGALSVLLLASLPAQGAPRDAIDLSQAQVYNSPTDVASWPITTAITRLEMQPTAGQAPGLTPTFSAEDTWPDYTPPGWGGPIEFTVWAVLKINGQWVTSGFIQMWRGRGNTGAPILTDFAVNWAYDGRWGPMSGYQPHVGEQMGFFVTAGNARGVFGVTSVRERSNVVVVSLPAGDSGVFTFPDHVPTKMDFDGDGRADLAVYRPSTGTAYIRSSVSGAVATFSGGLSTDVPVPGDYDGDGITDAAVFRPTTGAWYVGRSSTGTGVQYVWGGSIDVPVPSDYDGDGKTDVAVFRPSTGVWYILQSSTNSGVSYTWGGSIDTPVPGDYDGDGKADIAVLRPSTGAWYILQSSTNSGVAYTWGGSIDTPVPGDYDGDGKTDIAVFRPSTGGWYILLSSTRAGAQYTWGGSIDTPVPGDYDGDGKTDVAVFRPSTGTWWVLGSIGQSVQYAWGTAIDVSIQER